MWSRLLVEECRMKETSKTWIKMFVGFWRGLCACALISSSDKNKYRTQVCCFDLFQAGGRQRAWNTVILATKAAVHYWFGNWPLSPLQHMASHQNTKAEQAREYLSVPLKKCPHRAMLLATHLHENSPYYLHQFNPFECKLFIIVVIIVW